MHTQKYKKLKTEQIRAMLEMLPIRTVANMLGTPKSTLWDLKRRTQPKTEPTLHIG